MVVSRCKGALSFPDGGFFLTDCITTVVLRRHVDMWTVNILSVVKKWLHLCLCYYYRCICGCPVRMSF